MEEWVSLRNRWPEEPGTYNVRDCRRKVEGISEYDGFDFQKPQFRVPEEGSLLYVEHFVTHWRPNDT